MIRVMSRVLMMGCLVPLGMSLLACSGAATETETAGGQDSVAGENAKNAVPVEAERKLEVLSSKGYCKWGPRGGSGSTKTDHDWKCSSDDDCKDGDSKTWDKCIKDDDSCDHGDCGHDDGCDHGDCGHDDGDDHHTGWCKYYHKDSGKTTYKDHFGKKHSCTPGDRDTWYEECRDHEDSTKEVGCETD